MQFTRREFLVAGGVAGISAINGFGLPELIYAGTQDGQSQPIERTLFTLCGQCPGGCGLRVRIAQNQVIGIAGNPVHPINRGGVCARAIAAVQTLYNPDRLKGPMVLSGPRGSGQYRPIDWADAVERLAAKLRSTRQYPGPHSMAVLINGDRGLSRLLWSRFLQSYGSNNLIDLSAPEGHQAYPALLALQGLKRPVGYDLARAQYLLSFGSQWLDAHWSPAQASEAFASLRGSQQATRPRFIHIEPRLSLTGAKADEWIPIRPRTEGALAMGLAHVIVREGIYDREFVEQLTYGFDAPPGTNGERLGYRQLVLRDYSPARVARITGVEEGTIFRLAREFATYKPALAMGFDGSGVATQRCCDRMAIHALNALVGSIDVPGGVSHFQNIDLLKLPLPPLDAAAEQGLAKPRIDQADPSAYPLADSTPHAFEERILASLPYPLEILVLAGGNPVFSNPHPERVRQAMAKVPFVVSLSPWLDDSARLADLIIPEAHFLTRWDVDGSHTLTGQPTVTMGQPVVMPGPEGRGSADLILEVAQKLGDPIAAALPFKDAQAVVRAVYDTLFASNRGGPFGPIEEVGLTQLMERAGWRAPAASHAEEFYRKVLETGGWADPVYYHREWDRVFRSPPQRFSFYSALIAERVKPKSADDDARCLPHYEAPEKVEVDESFPLLLYVYPLSLLAGAKDVNVPWLMDACGAYMRQRWRGWVEINPATAERMHIADGDVVLITSARGKLQTKAKLFEGIRPEVVAMPWGLGHEGGGRWTSGIGENPASLVAVDTDPLTSGPLWNATPVSIRRV